MQAINLLPAKTGRSGFSLGGDSRRGQAMVLGAVALFAAVTYMGWTARQDAADVAEQVAVAQADNDALNHQLQQLLAADQQAARQEARRGQLVQLTAARINWERIIRDTVTVIPRERVSLTKVKAVAPATAMPTPAPAAAATANQPQTATPVQGLHLEGIALTQPDVAQLISRLEAVPGLGTPHVTSSDAVLKGKKWVVSFVLEIPVDQRAQDRATLIASAEMAAAAQGTSAPGAAAPGGMVP